MEQLITGLFEKILGLLYAVAGPLCIIFLFFGAYKILFAGGNEEKTAAGWKTIISAIIGYGLVLVLGGMPQLIQNLLRQ